MRPQFGIDQALGSASAWGRVLVRAGFLRPFVRVALDVQEPQWPMAVIATSLLAAISAIISGGATSEALGNS